MDIIGTSHQIQDVCKRALQVAITDFSVLITGETGTGKELIARLIHESSHRKDGPFIVINSPAIPDELSTSELFGHEKGTFTDADNLRIGKFELAHKGTILLDEICEMELSVQVKILRVLEDKKIQRLGSNEIIDTDIRVIATTNKDIRDTIDNNTFRKDLYYRINIFHIHISPLRERKEDIPLLSNYYVREYARISHNRPLDIVPEAMKKLIQYSWPGNVRELQNIILEAVTTTEGNIILPENLSIPDYHTHGPTKDNLINSQGGISLEEAEKRCIQQVLIHTWGNKTKAANILGISLPTLSSKIKKYRIGIGKGL